MNRKLFAICISILLTQMNFAQSFDKVKLDNYFDTLQKYNRFMGSVAVSENGQLIYTKSINFCDVEDNIKANKSSKYRIGSISKTFTAVLVLKAVEEKKVDLNQTIDIFFPTIKNAGKITIQQLLNQRSGIYNYSDNKSYLEWNTIPHTQEEMIAMIAKGGSEFTPDSTFKYSNSNYLLLSYILEKSYKKPYAELLATYITRPLALADTYEGGKIKTAANECRSYTFLAGWTVQPETDSSIFPGAGGVVSTASDLVKFSDALFSGKLLTAAHLEMMKTIRDGYGMGLFQAPFYGKTGYGHTGGIDGFSSVFSHFAEGNISYALVSNGTNLNNNDISIAVLSAAYNKPFSLPEFTFYAVSPDDLDKYAGVYSSKEIPLKITISKMDKTLIAQATGQPSFPLEATEKDKFKFSQAGVMIEFDPAEKAMILKQRGGEYHFMKE